MNIRHHVFLYPVILDCIVAAIPSNAAAQPLLNPANGHYYEFIASVPNLSWTDARSAAEFRIFQGQRGYLANVTSPVEEKFLRDHYGQRSLVWIGGSDAAVEGDWRWVTGPEGLLDGGRGLLFWRGGIQGTPFGYQNWIPGVEPNGIVAGENYIDWNHNGSGGWNDIRNQAYPTDSISGYFVEYGDVAGPTVQVTSLIAAGSTWSYLDNGSNQGTFWRNVDLDDGNWSRGDAPFGYGDDDEQTIVDCGPGPEGNCSPANGLSNNFATTYFRIAGELEGEFIAALQGVTASIVRDDGAAVYLNGVEVYRDASLRPGAAFNDLANFNGAGAVGGDDENAWHSFLIDPALFHAGPNVIAVEVHQQGPNSSDLSFDFQMSALVTVVPEPSTWMLAVMGLVPLVIGTHRRRNPRNAMLALGADDITQRY